MRRPLGVQRQTVHQLARRTYAAVLPVQMAEGLLRKGKPSVQELAQLPPHSRYGIHRKRRRREHGIGDPRTQQHFHYTERLHPRSQKSQSKSGKCDGRFDRRKRLIMT